MHGRPPPGEIYRFGPMRIVRRPVATTPPTGVLCMVDDMGAGRRGKLGGARYSAGDWVDIEGRPIGWTPTHWTIPEA